MRSTRSSSADLGLHQRHHATPRDRRSARRFPDAGRRDARGRRRQPDAGRGRGAGHRRRVGIRQERDDAGAPRSRRVPWPGAREADRLRRPRLAEPLGRRTPQGHRQGPGDDLPGPDHEPQSVLHDRLSAHRNAASASRARPQGRAEPRRGAAGASGHSRRREPPQGFSAPAVGRHESARDDRHGDRLQSAAADRRRADHGARRDDPGPDSGSAARTAAGTRHGAGPGDAQHGRRRRNGPPRRRDVRGSGGRGTRRRRAVRRAAAPLHGGAACRRCPSAAPASGAWRPFRAWCPGSTIGPTAASSLRAATTTPAICAASVRTSGRGPAARFAATFRSACRTATPPSPATASSRGPPHERRRAARPPAAAAPQPAIGRGGPRPAAGVFHLARPDARARPPACRRRRVVRHRGRPHARGGGRIGLRQVHARAHRGAHRKAHGRDVDARRSRCGPRVAGRAGTPAQVGPDGVPEPLRLAQSAQEDRRHPRGAARDQHRSHGTRNRPSGRGRC